MSATVDIIGYTVTSGSNPFLKEMNAISIVISEFVNPKTIVADMTIKMSEKSAKVIPQNKLPKTMDNKLIATVVSKVMNIMDLKSM